MKHYGMFTDTGNAFVHGLVMSAKAAKFDWNQVYDIMSDAKTIDGLEEIMDTEVREAVYIELENEYGLE